MFTFWRRGSRLSALEDEARRARAERDEMRSVLIAFEAACRVAGVRDFSSAAGDAVSGVSPALLAATRAPRTSGEPVILTLGGVKVVAVIGPGGEPGDQMTAIRAAAHSAAGQQGTSIARVPMPEGLLAVAAMPAAGALAVQAASDLTGRQARDAVHEAMAAARRNGWHGSALPVAAAVALHALRVMQVKHAAAAGVAVAGAAAAMALVLPAVNVPYSVHAGSIPPPPAASRTHDARQQPTQPPATPGVTSPGGGAQPQAAGAPSPAGTTAPADPSPLVSVSLPSPSQSPPPLLQVQPGPPGLGCVKILGLGVCV